MQNDLHRFSPNASQKYKCESVGKRISISFRNIYDCQVSIFVFSFCAISQANYVFILTLGRLNRSREWICFPED